LRGFFVKTVVFVGFAGLIWLGGNRYGAPEWLTGATDPGFSFVERQISRLPGDAETTSDDSEAADTKAPAAGDVEVSGLNVGLRTNQTGLDIIKDSEGLELEVYTVRGQSYIGYGHQWEAGDPEAITEAEAERLLRDDIRVFEDGVRARLERAATENQFSAMVSLAYTLGLGGFDRSPVLARFNDGDIEGAADAFLTHNRAGGQVVDYLIARRERERALFLTP